MEGSFGLIENSFLTEVLNAQEDERDANNIRIYPEVLITQEYERDANNIRIYPEFLITQESKKMAYELILQLAFEVFPITYNLISDSASTAAFKNWVVRYLYQNIAVGYYTPHRELVAVDFLIFRQIGVPSPPPSIFTGEPFYKFIEYLNNIQHYLQRWYHCQQIDQNSWYLTSLGVFTKAAYKCQVNQKQIIDVRNQVAEALQIPVISPAFIGEEMQKVAKEVTYTNLIVNQVEIRTWTRRCLQRPASH